MTTHKITRKSVCIVCGKRLSEKTDAGVIRWRPAHVDDSGIYCEACRPPEKPKKSHKGNRA